MERIKLNIQLGIAVAVFIVGIGLLVAGFCLPPSGEIHNSVLVAFGEACTFSGSLIGVDYHYRFKEYAGAHQRKPSRHQAIDIVKEEENYEDN